VSAPAGPTYLAIPQDLLEHRGPVPCPDSAGFRVRARSRPDPEDVRAAADRLAAAARPLIVAGSEVARGGAWPELLALAERLGAPVLAEHFQTLDAAPSTIGDAPATLDVSGYAGVFDSGLEAVREADVIFLAGTRSPTQFDASFAAILPPATPLIHLSADAGEVAKRLPTTVPLVADPGLCLSDLNACLDEQQRLTEEDESRERAVAAHRNGAAGGDAFRERAVAAHREAVRRMREEADADADRVPIRVSALMRTLVAQLEPGSLIVDDSVTGKGSVLRHALAHDAGMRYLTTGGGSLGWAVGGALGAALAEPGTPVVGIVGDGVLQFGLPALWTAVHERIPVTFVVVNNRGYAAVKAALVRHGGQAADEEIYPASELPGPDFAAIADGFGALGRRVEHLDELESSLADARASGGPAVIDVLTDPADLGPRVPPKGGRS
jgi:benzoylformate decarboxylase